LRSHASASSGEAFPVNSTNLCRRKSSTFGTLIGAITTLGYAATSSCIASTIWSIASAMSSAPFPFLLFQLPAIAWIRHISTVKNQFTWLRKSTHTFTTFNSKTTISQTISSHPKSPKIFKIFSKLLLWYQL